MFEAEKIGHSEDVCTYVKSDIGMMQGKYRTERQEVAQSRCAFALYTGCFTFMKWFESSRQYKCETVMLHTPYMGDGKITKNMLDYMVKQLKEEVIPKLERVSGVKFDIDRLREYLKKSPRPRTISYGCCKALRPSSRRSMPISVAFITLDRSSAPSAALRMR